MILMITRSAPGSSRSFRLLLIRRDIFRLSVRSGPFGSLLLKASDVLWRTAAIGSLEPGTVVLLCRGAIQSATLIPVLQPLDRREDGQRRGVDDHGYCRTAQADSQTSAVDRVEPTAAP